MEPQGNANGQRESVGASEAGREAALGEGWRSSEWRYQNGDLRARIFEPCGRGFSWRVWSVVDKREGPVIASGHEPTFEKAAREANHWIRTGGAPC